MTRLAISSEKQSAYFQTLVRIVEEIGPRGSMQSGLKSLLRTLCENHGYKRALLTIFDPETNSLKLTVTVGSQRYSEVSYQPGQGVTGQVMDSGESVIVPVQKDDPHFLNLAFGRTKEEMSKLGFICVPVRHADDNNQTEVLGTLSVDVPAGTQEELEADCNFLQVVASLVAKEVASLQEEMAMQRHLLAQGMTQEPHDSSDDTFSHPNIIAASKPMRMVLQQVSQVGPSRATVLLRGESGTGKELLAEAIHSVSPRKNKPLIKLNCAALPAELIESELFGHVKGAFTGAVSSKKGLFELADGGTLFLDEIGELSLEAQAKLLRAIQEREIQRIGSEQTIRVDARLITATNRSLEQMLEDGTLREDLFYRINVFPIFIPPLRERRLDILPLAEHFMQRFSEEYKKDVKRISTPAIDMLQQYHWPGNVRELGNCMERAVLICDEEVIRTYHLPPSLQTAESSATDTNLSFGESVARFEQELLVDALKKARGNMLQAARDLKASYRIINYKVKKYHLDPKKFAVGKSRKRS
ncbi:sigma-54-dependent Fis family transcriptional regulator [Desulfobaculum bizertense]|uniref:Nif-specific regulatory protein n=1 Tax=Desulfobaculum bizertense DSM 18034 TaxID=1121442 RepID=A0A1T4VKP2_9BACT|nr:sigma 54-interacting transcriptional regulator [Desulfobaculum bizertense]UIJ38087.1 sigma 54-interacting transcriptional regulator [Desulfobaculum bizertense]SKA65493.1 Nif-specific regulatory protein [Desulfobaculum bizertense DSM 18034]